MNTGPIEAVLAEIGKAWRLCRFYPGSHPSVQQALASLSAALPGLSAIGTIELRLQPSGMLLGNVPVAPRNPQVAELANLLYSQGHRMLVLEPGLTGDEVAALIRAAASGTERAMQAVGGRAAFENLPHIRLERAARRATTERPRASSGSPQEGPTLGRRTSAVFRPDALPPEIEARRLAAHLEAGGDAASVERLGALVAELTGLRDFRTLTVAVRALGRVARRGGAAVRAPAAEALTARVTPAALSGVLSCLSDARVAPAERDMAVEALGALGGRAIPMVFDAYHSAEAGEEREILLAVVRQAGAAAAEVIMARMDADARGETARLNAQLLGATRASNAALMLGVLARHAEVPVRVAAVDALAHVDDPEAERQILAALRDTNAAVRVAAARAVAATGNAAQVPVILARLGAEEDDAAAIALMWCLGELRDPRAVALLADVARGVAGVFQRRPPAVCAAAVRALGAIGSDEALAEVEEHHGGWRGEVRAAASEVLRAAGRGG